MKLALPYPRAALALLAFAVLCLAGLLSPRPAYADGIFIPAPSRIDGMFDASGHIVYVSDGGQVLGYDLGTRTFLPPFALGGQLMGMDLSPDGKTLAVADGAFSTDSLWIHLVHLDTETSEKISFPRATNEAGTFAVAYGSDGRLLLTSRSQTQAYVPLRRYDPATGATDILAEVRRETMLSASADRSTIAYVQGYQPDGDGTWCLYVVASGSITAGVGTNFDGFEIAANHNATQIAVGTSVGAYIYNSPAPPIGIIGSFGVPPLGLAYHPAQNLLYVALSDTPFVGAFDAVTFQQRDLYKVVDDFPYPWPVLAFLAGRLKTSGDGSLLLVTVPGGVRVLSTSGFHTETSLAISPGPFEHSTPFTLTATVRRLPPASGLPTGRVTFYLDESWRLAPLGSAAPDATGTATLTTMLTGGAFKLVAELDDGLEDRASTSGPIYIQLGPAATAIVLEGVPANAVYGQSLVVTAVFSTLKSHQPITDGNYQLLDGTAMIARGDLDGSARVVRQIDWLEPGLHCLTAHFDGNWAGLASTSPPVCVTIAPADTLIEARSTRVGTNTSIAVTVRAGAPANSVPTGLVTFYEGPLSLGTVALDSAGQGAVVLAGLSDTGHFLRIEYPGSVHYKPATGWLALGPLRKHYLPSLSRSVDGQ